MKKFYQFLPFILWSIATVILTILALIALPVLILWKKAESFFHGNSAEGAHDAEEQPGVNSIVVV